MDNSGLVDSRLRLQHLTVTVRVMIRGITSEKYDRLLKRLSHTPTVDDDELAAKRPKTEPFTGLAFGRG